MVRDRGAGAVELGWGGELGVARRSGGLSGKEEDVVAAELGDLEAVGLEAGGTRRGGGRRVALALRDRGDRLGSAGHWCRDFAGDPGPEGGARSRRWPLGRGSPRRGVWLGAYSTVPPLLGPSKSSLLVPPLSQKWRTGRPTGAAGRARRSQRGGGGGAGEGARRARGGG